MNERAVTSMLLAVLAAAGRVAAAEERVFRAGACAVDITPTTLPAVVSGGFLAAKGEKVVDPLHARALVLDDGATRVAIAVVDTLMMPRDIIDKARELARASADISVENILIAATHTHSAPAAMGALGTDPDPDYAPRLPGMIARAIDGAWRNLAPARIGWAVARDAEHTHCRRWILRPDRMQVDPFGARSVRAMMHPGYQNPDYIGPAGPADDQVSVVSIQSREGRPMAVLANYSQHYVGSPPISADYFGVFAEKIRDFLGAGNLDPPFVGILSQGTAGDLHWMDYSKPKVDLDRFRIGEALARIACEAIRGIQYRDWIPLAARETSLKLMVRAPDPERLSWAQAIVDGLQGRPPSDLKEVYAREQVLLARDPIREVNIQVLKLGDLGISAIPAEVFGLTGLKIKVRSPLVPTFNMELAGGAEGYIPPPEQHLLGGYTTWPARTAGLEVGAEPRIVEAALSLLEEVSGKPRRRPLEGVHPYARAVLQSGPVAFWRMGDMEGPAAADAAGGGRPGAFEGRVAFFLEGPGLPGLLCAGEASRAVHFAGGWMKADVPDARAACSVELWFWNGLPCDSREIAGHILSLEAPGSGEEVLGIGGAGPQAGRVFFEAGSGVRQVLAGSSATEPGTWNHLVLVRDGAKLAVWLNGKLELAGESPPAGDGPARGLVVGGKRDGPFNFEGKIDEVALYSRALSSEDVRRHWEVARSGESPGAGAR